MTIEAARVRGLAIAKRFRTNRWFMTCTICNIDSAMVGSRGEASALAAEHNDRHHPHGT